jgi:hypothetical protein
LQTSSKLSVHFKKVPKSSTKKLYCPDISTAQRNLSFLGTRAAL